MIITLQELIKKNDNIDFINEVKNQLCELYKQLSELDNIPTYVFFDILYKHRIYLYIINNKIIGVVTIVLERKMIHNGGIVAHIEDLVIDKNHRNKKIGSQLISQAIQYAKENNCYKTILSTNDDNIIFYEKSGFTCKNKEMSIYFT